MVWYRPVILAALTPLFAALGACDGASAPAIEMLESESETLPITWAEGMDDTLTAFGDGSVSRCWKVQTRFDCVHVSEFDIRSEIADAPVRREMFRFSASELPTSEIALRALQGSDGYSCRISHALGATYLTEQIVKNGKVLEEKTSVRAYDKWPPSEAAEKIDALGASVRRRYLNCDALDRLIARQGLVIVDSSLVTYEGLFLVGPPVDDAFEAERNEPVS
ncbi:hypothetical protein GCM10011371_33330 [Novosphingobium marinum]|uniref:Lipoprotein n=2 Tax=Novosphingobium marinum TaxID=1514948 RepID=A0A7Z0BX70_9SPHN|nr:hypothetical protein [Novosphingobium marinum]NYH97057.1 hypothetical protein [Novosphingobium marinum]GGC43194.1 hypothetical protein GCM10011371_33330 [Novosphingobium marinum]